MTDGKVDVRNSIIFLKLQTRAVVAEQLRRLTRNQIPSGSVGSNPTNCESYPVLSKSFMCYIVYTFPVLEFDPFWTLKGLSAQNLVQDAPFYSNT
jgi:hypothetical protein